MNKSNVQSQEAFIRNNVPQDFYVRLNGFVNLGIPREQLMEVISQALTQGKPGTREWSQSLLAEADNFSQLAQPNEKDWLNVSFWYFLARFPYYFNKPMKEAYEKQKEAYLKANLFSANPIEMVKIAFEGQQVTTYLRKPKLEQGALPPLVIIWGGIDVWKSDLQIHQIGNALLAKGIAVLAVDGPGTGECPIPISTSAESWFIAIINAMKARVDINSEKIACYGLSFGGYWANKLAIQLPWLAGAVNVGGPAHYTFAKDWMEQLPRSTYETLAYTCGFEDPEDLFLTYSAELSLLDQGLLPATANAPLLLINGAKDNLVTIREMDFLKEQGVKTDALIFSEDRHVASQNWKLHSQLSVNWLEEKLK